jgi:hypothetical protein
MPRRELSVARTQSMVASATVYSSRRRRKDRDPDGNLRGGEEWQRAAWDFYDMIGEYRQAPTIMGALLSRAKLVVHEKGSDGVWAPTTNPTALTVMEELFGGEEGQAEMLRLFGIHFTVAGEGYLISPADGDDNPDEWTVAAATEVTRTNNVWKVNGKPLKGQRMVLRIWRPHPRNRKKPDAPTRAVLPILSELLQLTKRVAAQIDSRLTGNGITIFPSETNFGAIPSQVYNQGDPAQTVDSITGDNAQGLADMVARVAEIAMQNPESAEARLPIFATAPGEYISKAKHLTFWSELDEAAPALREEAITRIARGMDVPPEILLGGSGSNHWNMWLSDENNIKIHGEPTLKTVTAGLTTKYLRPALDGEDGVSDPRNFRVEADTSQMRLRPNRSKEAQELNQSLILSDEAVLRENGFTEEDMMSDEGLQKALLRKMASGSTTPEIVAIAARILGVDIPEITDNRAPAEARPAPSLREHPVRELPAPKRAASPDGLVFAAEQMVDRALQRAGNRLKTRYQIKEPPAAANRLYLHVPVAYSDVDDLLADAWECTELSDYGVEPAALARALDTYTRAVILGQRAPSRSTIAGALRLLLSDRAA